MKTVKLDNPITVDGIEVSELTFRPVKVRYCLTMERAGSSDFEKEVGLIANLASVTKETIWELYFADYMKIQEELKDFFSIGYTKNLRLNVLMLCSVIGGGIEQVLEMEINEFILWTKAAGEFKCQHYQ